ncbi:unnamed protein product [Pelagomonas calceolata]|uniref:Uncharacterized protein n=2 Tax=Pelagomonas calceolata TaxID=35677 RepID=A0A8J2SQQ7_9STRA|nr:unnamed protein product [Pelagomonas calceolata]
MSFHVTMSSTLRGRNVQLFEVEYLGEAITSVAADVVRRLHEAGFKLKSVYLGGSKHWVAAKSIIGVHSMPLNNLGLEGLEDGDAQMFTFAVKVKNLQGYKADGKAYADGVGAEETWRRAVVKALRQLFGQGFDELNINLCGASVHKDDDGSLVLYCCCSTVPAGTFDGTRDLYQLALRDGTLVPGYTGITNVRWSLEAQDFLVEVVKAQGGTGYWDAVAALVNARFPGVVRSPSACGNTYGALALRRADAPLGPAPGVSGGIGAGRGHGLAVVDLGHFPREDRDAIEKACADAAALAAARSTQAATHVRYGEVWTGEQDAALRRAVFVAGPPPSTSGRHGYWPKVAATMPDRTDKQCRRRWKYELDPNMSKVPLTKEELRIVLSEVSRKKGPGAIAKRLPGRTDHFIKNKLNGGLKKRLEAFLKKQPSPVLDLSGPLLEKAVKECMAPRPRSRPRKKTSVSVPSPPSSPPSVLTPLAAAAAVAPEPLPALLPAAPSPSTASPDATPSPYRKWLPDEDALLWEAYKATNNGTMHLWTNTAAKRVGTRSAKQCAQRMPKLLAAFQRGIEAEAGGGARAAVTLPSRPRAPPPPTEVRPSLQDFRDKRVVISGGDLPASKQKLKDVLVELLHVEAVTRATSGDTHYVIGRIGSGDGNVTKAGNRLVDVDYFMSLLEEGAIERAKAARVARLEATPIVWCDDRLTPQALRGKGVARTGGVTGLTLHQVRAEIQRLGATVHKSVTKKTDFLVYGHLSKECGAVKAARKHRVPCIPEAVFRDLLSAASAPAPAPCAVAAPSPRRRALAENGPRDEPAAKRHC